MQPDGRLATTFCDLTNLEEVSFSDILAADIDFGSYDGLVIAANFQSEVIQSVAKLCHSIRLPYALEPVSNYKAPWPPENAIKGAALIKPTPL